MRIVLALAASASAARWPFTSDPLDFWAGGGKLFVSSGAASARLHLKGVSWFGFETSTACVHELWYLDGSRCAGIDGTALPYAVPAFTAAVAPSAACDASYARAEGSGAFGPCEFLHGECRNAVETRLCPPPCKDWCKAPWHTTEFPTCGFAGCAGCSECLN